ncbi:hypothetical protein SETIT_8G190000v2 [Setaria italica]|uniref:Uncharacterized protein n=1 Tax=Setaria italica TaxID=4555 RepID=A0A368S9E7_SETIT|nr:hypothetical protein SETIT_8G190000v2 [Setaria italica]
MGPKRKRRRLPLLGATGAATGASDSGGLDGGSWRRAARTTTSRPSTDDCSPSPDAAAEERETTVRRVNTDVQATKDGFAAFQAWVHGVVDKDSRVMLGRDHRRRVVGGERELSMGDGDGVVFVGSDDAAFQEDGEGAMASSSSSSKMRVPRGPHLQTLSIYLSLIYQRMT